MLNEAEKKKIEKIIRGYQRKPAASMEVLRMIQGGRGWVSGEDLSEAAELLEMSQEELDGIASFYDLIFRKPVGRHVVLVCDSVSCWTMGYKGIRDRLVQALGINVGETSPDGRFTLLPVACIGMCDHAPAMVIDTDLYEDVTVQEIDEILSRYE